MDAIEPGRDRRHGAGTASRLILGLAMVLFAWEAVAFEAFTSIDSATGLFRHQDAVFPLLSVTYVQPQAGRLGTNAGPIHMLAFDLTRLRSDFGAMRSMGIGAIYMRVGSGFFLNPDGSWRRPEDPYTGVPDADAARQETLARLNAARAAGIGPFVYNHEIFEFLLDNAAAEGLRVVPMIMDVWSMPRKLDLGEQRSCILYPNAWQSVIDDWTKILARFRERKEILGYLIEGENFMLPVWGESRWHFLEPGGPVVKPAASPLETKDPEITRQFQAFLKNRYGNVECFKKCMSYGYDRTRVTYAAGTGIPSYPFEAGVWDRLRGFSDVSLPIVEREKGGGSAGPGPDFPYWLNVPFDTLWMEFAYFKEWLYTARLNQLFAALRKVCPNQLLFHSAAWDYAASWHPFFIAWNHGALNCDVQLHGGGYPEFVVYQTTPPTVRKHETVLELYQSVGCYRPFASAGRTPSAYGMGEGGMAYESNRVDGADTGVAESVEEAWNTALILDNLGSGSAFANLWDWGMFVGATRANPELHEHRLAATTREMAAIMERDTFVRDRPAQVLILANGPTLHSLMKEVTANNVMALSSTLAAAHYAFDIATTDEVATDGRPEKVDLRRYRAIFIPDLFQIPDGSLSGNQPLDRPGNRNLWVLLRDWLDRSSDRLLCIGGTGLRDSWFRPVDQLPRSVRAIVGNVTAGPLVKQDGEHVWKTSDGANLHVVLDGTFLHQVFIGTDDRVAAQPFLIEGDRVLGSKSVRANGSRVHFFGFPLGLSWMYLRDNPLSGGRLNEAFDVSRLAAFYTNLLRDSGLNADYAADPDVVAHISDHGRALMVRRRVHKDRAPGAAAVQSGLLAGQLYADARSEIVRTGTSSDATVTVDLKENHAALAFALGGIELLGEGRLHVSAERTSSDAASPRYRVHMKGDVPARFCPYGVTGQDTVYQPDTELEFVVPIQPTTSCAYTRDNGTQTR